MTATLHVLIVDDSAGDAGLIARLIEQAGYKVMCERVDSAPSLVAALAKHAWDVILCDFRMPDFSGTEALDIVRASNCDVPLIFVSGTMGEDAAVEAMRAGAQDYVVKGNLKRLMPAIERELREVALRRARRHMEELLRLRTIALESADSSIVITRRDGRIEWVNPAFTRLTGYSQEESVGQSMRLLKSDLQAMATYDDLWRTILAGGVWRGTLMNRRKDGTIYPEEQVITPVRGEGGEITHFISIQQDITERTRAEKELKFRNAILSTQQEVSLDGILVLGEDTRVVSCNARFIQMWSVQPEWIENREDQLLLRHVAGQFADPESFLMRVQQLHEDREETSYEEIRLIDGRILDRYSAPMFGADSHYYGRVWYFRDITERKRLEEQFRQSQKMEAVGQLAGGVAHDFNNILSAMIMQTDLIGMEANQSAEVKEGLKQIRAYAERAANLTRQLLLFSRKQVMQLRTLDLNQIVISLAKMLQRIIGEDVRLQLNLHPGTLNTRADAGMLDQVLMNLVVNARDAMPNGGLIIIETTERTVTRAEAETNPEISPGRYVCLRVADTGCGIAPENIPHIFEPFFSTKEPGKGTGLGLATVFGIVKQHGGSVSVQSQAGSGATFYISLPAVEGTHGSEQAVEAAAPRGGTETILLVEDETSVRRLTRVVLERHGYQVLEAANGIEAQQIWELYQSKIQLLLTDIVMPEGISGRELAERLQASNPQLRVIFTSGYSAEIAGRELILLEGQNFLQKPPSTHQLLETVRRSLDA